MLSFKKKKLWKARSEKMQARKEKWYKSNPNLLLPEAGALHWVHE